MQVMLTDYKVFSTQQDALPSAKHIQEIRLENINELHLSMHSIYCLHPCWKADVLSPHSCSVSSNGDTDSLEEIEMSDKENVKKRGMWPWSKNDTLK